MTNGKLYIHNAQCSLTLMTPVGTFSELKYGFVFQGYSAPIKSKINH